MRRILCALAWLLLLFSIPCAAAEGVEDIYAEQYEQSGAADLYKNLSPETQEILNKWGIRQADWEQLLTGDIQKTAESIWEMLLEHLRAPLNTLCVLLGIVLLCAWTDGLRAGLTVASVSEVFRTVCVLSACTAVSVPLTQCLKAVSAAMESVSVFMYSFVPVYAGILLTSGHAAAAMSYRTVLLGAGQLLTQVVNRLVLPMTTCGMALDVTGSASAGVRPQGVGRLLGRITVWLLGGMSTLFVGMLTLRNTLGTAADSLGSRMARFSLAGFIPVVGGSLGEALSTVQNCLTLLRGTVGMFGVAAVAAIVLPPVLQCLAWQLCMAAAEATAELFGLTAMQSLMKGLGTALKMMVAALALCALFMVVSTAVVMGGT